MSEAMTPPLQKTAAAFLSPTTGSIIACALSEHLPLTLTHGEAT
ncbi:hypothetical protein SAMN05216202_4288 [Pseudomonas mucidolens]|uniref:Uncharacterized protein n=1 Tax=Pseudomonas mucidolens TaxID=46679 RepID=A0A1H2NQA1_9PSED|nr:hypothetical protein SAMN05216202_4288 [Pseudomonas mucidolens]SQH31401.1 Uncharacterised protein [Pseudomonas mucidolens]